MTRVEKIFAVAAARAVAPTQAPAAVADSACSMRRRVIQVRAAESLRGMGRIELSQTSNTAAIVAGCPHARQSVRPITRLLVADRPLRSDCDRSPRVEDDFRLGRLLSSPDILEKRLQVIAELRSVLFTDAAHFVNNRITSTHHPTGTCSWKSSGGAPMMW